MDWRLELQPIELIHLPLRDIGSGRVYIAASKLVRLTGSYPIFSKGRTLEKSDSLLNQGMDTFRAIVLSRANLEI